MDFEPTEEQRLFRDSIERFFQDAYDFETRGRILAEPAGYSTAHWHHFAEQGLLALLVPEAFGGLGGTVADVQVAMAAIGRHLFVSPFFASAVVATGAIAAAASDDQKGRLLPALAEGRRIATLAHGEPEGRFDLAHVSTRAARAGA